MNIRMPKPLEAAILLVLAAVCERNYINFRSEEEVLAALNRAGHHPTENIFHLALRRMEEGEMIIKTHRLANGYAYSDRMLEEMIERKILKPEEARAATTVYGVCGYYISNITGALLEEDEARPTLSKPTLAAAELFCQNAWSRSAYAY